MVDFPPNGAVGTYNWGTVDSYGRVIEARDSSIISVVATESVPAFSPITINGQLANSDNPFHIGRVVGITRARILPRFSGEVQTYGELVNPLWRWSPGESIFVNGTYLSRVAPSVGWIKKIGVAKNSTTIIVELESSILL
jgi:hypothetical protein